MRAGPPNQFSTADPSATFPPEVKSLFPNILRVSPCGSRFCRDLSPSLLCQAFIMNILGATKKENSRYQRQNTLQPAPKSLFQNILHASPCGSRSYEDEAPSPSLKPLRMNTLEKLERKNVEGTHPVRIRQSTPPNSESKSKAGRASASAQN